MAKSEKICIVCGNSFNGTAKAECCGSNCRVKLKRLLEKGKQPEFRLIGGKNTPSKHPENFGLLVPNGPAKNSDGSLKRPDKKFKYDAPPVVQINDELKQWEEPKSGPAVKVAIKRGAYMNDAIKKKLGLG